MKTSLQNPRDDTDENEKTLVYRSLANKKQMFICLILGVILWIVFSENISKISLLSQRNQDLESDQLALKVEVSRLIAEVSRKYLEIETMEKKLEMLVEEDIKTTINDRLISIILTCIFGIIIIITITHEMYLLVRKGIETTMKKEKGRLAGIILLSITGIIVIAIIFSYICETYRNIV